MGYSRALAINCNCREARILIQQKCKCMIASTRDIWRRPLPCYVQYVGCGKVWVAEQCGLRNDTEEAMMSVHICISHLYFTMNVGASEMLAVLAMLLFCYFVAHYIRCALYHGWALLKSLLPSVICFPFFSRGRLQRNDNCCEVLAQSA